MQMQHTKNINHERFELGVTLSLRNRSILPVILFSQEVAKW